jgi:hypothetical protein
MLFAKGRTVDDPRTNRMLLLALGEGDRDPRRGANTNLGGFPPQPSGYTVGDDQRDAQPTHPCVLGRERRSGLEYCHFRFPRARASTKHPALGLASRLVLERLQAFWSERFEIKVDLPGHATAR